MLKIKADNVLRIVDVHHNQLSSGLIQYLKQECQETYTDRVLNEHIYNMDDIFYEYREQTDYDRDILNEMESLIVLQHRKKAGYTRVIFN
jgi:hypothetical protein